MTDAQTSLLAQIQALTLAGSEQTGTRMYHEVQPWGTGTIWSTVRIIDQHCNAIASTQVVLRDGDDSVPHFDRQTDRCTLTEQRDQLVDWIAANRKEAA